MAIIDHCAECPYRDHGPAIGSRGDATARIVLVGEAPGATEVKEQEPFRGRAGDVLWRAVAAAQLSEVPLFVINAVACRPQPVRPRVGAVRACRGRLVRDLEAHPRAVIVALGVIAARALTERRGMRMLDAHGKELPSVWGPIIPALHPARILRRPAEYPLLVADLEHGRRLAGTKPIGGAD